MADCLSKRDIYLKDPVMIKGELRGQIKVPCGKCARCIERRKMEWGFRMEIEMGESKTAYFVTLTYAPSRVPLNKWGIKTLNNKEEINEEVFEHALFNPICKDEVDIDRKKIIRKGKGLCFVLGCLWWLRGYKKSWTHNDYRLITVYKVCSRLDAKTSWR